MKKTRTISKKLQSYLKTNAGVASDYVPTSVIAKGSLLAALPVVLLSNQSIAQVRLDATINDTDTHCDVGPCGNLDRLDIKIDDGFNGSDEHSGFNIGGTGGTNIALPADVDLRININPATIWFDGTADFKAVATNTIYPAMLTQNASVGPGNVMNGYNSGPNNNRFFLTFSDGATGNWLGAGNGEEDTGYLGFAFKIGGNTHYGFMELGVTDDNNSNADGNKSIRIIGIGYEQQPNTPINGLFLPVDFKSIELTPRGAAFVLDWATATETDNAGFEVQRSTDGNNFTTVKFVEGRGTTDTAQSYSFTDADVKKRQTYFYRLRQVDYSGAFKYSKIVSGQLLGEDFVVGEFYPNPISGKQVSLDLDTRFTGAVTVDVFDAQGKQMSSESSDTVKGSNRITLNLPNLSKGIYFAKVTQAGNTEYRKMVVE